MARIGALSGHGEILIGGIGRGHVRYAIDEDGRDHAEERLGRLTGDDALLQALCEHAFEAQLRCPGGMLDLQLRSYVLGRGSAVVAVQGSVGRAEVPASV